MKIIYAKSYEEMSERAALLIREVVEEKPDAVLGLATGSTPIGMYQRLVEAAKDGLDLSKITTFNLDEYVGLPEEHPESYRAFMKKHLFAPIALPKAQTHFPHFPEEGEGTYEEAIQKAGGIDLQVLGMGRNGHIAFNEPAEALHANTGLVTLKESTIQANARFFDSVEEVPRQALSSGVGTIMKAKKILLLITGEEKKEVFEKFIADDLVTTRLPATLLKLHPDVTIIVDNTICNA